MKIKLDIPITLSEIAGCTGGSLSSADDTISCICTDSREVSQGDLFIAIRGERIDGNLFASEAHARGGYVIGTNGADITVYDAQTPILKLVNLYKCKLPCLLHTVAITGSVGKTTTKELVRCILSAKYNVHSTYENFNNHIGLLHTVLSAKKDTEVLVVELGMNHSGEISRLSRALVPDIALITNIGTAHIGNLGSREAIATAKLEVSDGMNSGTLIVPRDESLLNPDTRCTVSFNSYGGDFALFIGDTNERKTVFDFVGRNLTLESESVALKGPHLMRALGFALSVADILELHADDVRLALKSVNESSLRQKRFTMGKYDIYDDTYSSSPEAAIAVMEALTQQYPGKISAVLGDMLELGERSIDLHRMVGRSAVEHNICKLYLFGDFAMATAEGALAAGMPSNRIFINDNASNLEYTAEQIRCSYDDEVLIVKASHALRAERLFDFLKD